MSRFTQDPFNLPQGALIVAQVSAINSIGYSVPSSANVVGVTVQIAPPITPVAPLIDLSKTDETKITVVMTAINSLSDAGGSAITSYNLEWD
jgi:hypothetical protein